MCRHGDKEKALIGTWCAIKGNVVLEKFVMRGLLKKKKAHYFQKYDERQKAGHSWGTQATLIGIDFFL